jgi:hypothetical protein
MLVEKMGTVEYLVTHITGEMLVSCFVVRHIARYSSQLQLWQHVMVQLVT